MITFNTEKCIGCGLCVNDCVSYCITIKDNVAQMKSASRQCIQCGHCIAVCPQNAVSIEDSDYSISEITPVPSEYPALNSAAILHALKFRRSIRQYQEKKIEQSILEDLLQAARYSATGANSQRFRFVVVQNEMDTFKEMAWEFFDRYIRSFPEDAPQNQYGIVQRAKLPKNDPLQDSLFWGAPCLIIVAADHGGVWDAGLASQSIELTALSHNLGALYSGYLVELINNHDALRDWLGIADCQAKTCILIGYPAVHYYRSAPRKPANVIWK